MSGLGSAEAETPCELRGGRGQGRLTMKAFRSSFDVSAHPLSMSPLAPLCSITSTSAVERSDRPDQSEGSDEVEVELSSPPSSDDSSGFFCGVERVGSGA